MALFQHMLLAFALFDIAVSVGAATPSAVQLVSVETTLNGVTDAFAKGASGLSRKEHRKEVELELAVKHGKGRRQNAPPGSTVSICPFFTTMVAQGALAIQSTHSADELEQLCDQAGLSPEQAAGLRGLTFSNVPTDTLDIFDMEGYPNEHLTSTGISDCPSDFPFSGGDANACVFDAIVGNNVCPTQDKNCVQNQTRNTDRFESWFALTDTDNSGTINQQELVASQPLFDIAASPGFFVTDGNDGSQLNPPNPPSVDISAAMGLMILVFGESCEAISKTALDDVILKSRFPAGYTFPSARICR